MRVLVVESDPTIRSWLESRLSSWGYDTSTASDADSAQASHQNDPASLILADWSIFQHGLSPLFELAQKPALAKTPYIIIMTPVQEPTELLSGLGSKANDTIGKPIQSVQLKARLMAAERIITLEQELLKQNQSLEIANNQMKKDLLVAARIQRSFLPHSPPRFPNVEFQWGLLPCEELAGDALNVIQLDQTHVGVYVLDVSGHGVSAALMAMTLIHLLSPDKPNSGLFETNSDQAGEYRILSPSEVTRRLNGQFPMDDINGQYFTCIYGILDLVSLQLKYASAGHPGPVLIKSSGDSQSFDSTGMPIGFVTDSSYGEGSIDLTVGDRLYFFSDGIPETCNKYQESFGNERLVSRLQKGQQARASLRKSIDDLLLAALRWSGGAHLADDVSVIGLEIKTPEKR